MTRTLRYFIHPESSCAFVSTIDEADCGQLDEIGFVNYPPSQSDFEAACLICGVPPPFLRLSPVNEEFIEIARSEASYPKEL